ncbi:acyl carrier protein [Kineosporia babensis]|uniref:Acyl carrier protein n=1 Tax=Kineosporia babensis TaxID=499548 RepID=A0A9X1NKA1_9ACTN|nr:acyl carrier protein [Kineosporia babensis]MCD5315713.1 acyl carrier protein [Kineosporia babensis]
MSTPITLTDLEDIMRRCAGEDETTSPLEQGPHEPFDELGYDSLALLETLNHIQRDYGVQISDDELDSAKTPRQLLDLVNRRLGVA